MSNLLTIGIVTHNSSSVIAECLATIDDHAPKGARVIVVDNNSSDATNEIVSQQCPSATFFNTGGNYGYGHGVNVLLSETKTPYLLILNADVLLHPTTCTPLIDYMNSDSFCIIAAPTTVDSQGNLEGNIRKFPTFFRTLATNILGGTRAGRFGMSDIIRDSSHYIAPHNVDWLKGAIWCVRVDNAIELGGMREDFFLYSEEREFAARALDNGFTSVIVPTATATHIGGESDFHPVLYALLHINNIRYEIVRNKRFSALGTFFIQLATEGLRSIHAHHRTAFISHVRATFGVEKEAQRLIAQLQGETTQPIFS